MQYSSVWAVLFFFMIILMGLDSQFVGVEGFVTAVVDLYPHILRKGRRRELFIVVVSVVSYLIGLLMVTNGGMYVFQVFDYYAASGMVLLWFCFFECIALAYCYGVDKFYDDIKKMVGYRMNSWMRWCWLYFTPFVTMGILIFSTASSLPLTYNRVYVYPDWAVNAGWTMALVPMSLIPIHFAWYLFTREGSTIVEKWRTATKPVLKDNCT